MKKDNNQPKKYDHIKIEKKWQGFWNKKKINKTSEGGKKPKCYVLDMFPYPSGEGLHVGHPRGYISTDVYSRFKRMNGFNVLHPMGWDAFGLPAENYAIKNKISPDIAMKKNVKRYKDQISMVGLGYDWDREINTTDPKYYKWTQWIFLQLFKKGLAFESYEPINWCSSCKTGLANEDLDGDKCERCGTLIEKKPMRQWVLKITDYADRLLNDLDSLNWPEHIKELQRNWIGRSEGSELWFNIANSEEKLRVFTTRPDTLYGVTYVVMAPEHKLVETLKSQIKNWKEVEKYIKEAKRKTEIERTSETKEKTGVELKGVIVKHPLTKEIIPVYISDYVLAHYGTGAVMAVPAHDERDYAFAKKYKLPIVEVVIPERIDKRNPPVMGKEKVERRNVQAVVKDPKTGKYLCLHSKKHNWNTFPMGGVKDGENLIDAAKREVGEEAGYINLKKGTVLGGQVYAEYFAKHKDQNRCSFTSIVTFELGGSEQIEISKEERDENDVLWIEKKDLNIEFMCHAEMDIWLERLNKDNHAYTGNGVMINSGEFDGMSNEEAKEKITDHADGKKKVTYKLKDWVFSRQRYWGEPIPVVHCEQCAINELKDKVVFDFHGNFRFASILSGEKKIETRAFDVKNRKEIKVGEQIILNHVKEGKKVVDVTEVWYFKDLSDLFKNGKKLIPDIFPGIKISTLDDLNKAYESVNKGYSERINKSGLGAWRIKVLNLDKVIPLSEKDLPLTLPKVKSYEPTGTGESPLAAITKWVNTKCPKCKGKAKRETNTMPQWAGSSWYYLRYMDPKNNKALVDKKKEKYWAPVDMYVGGTEHATRHLIYARFWHKFLLDIGVVSTSEPFKQLRNMGMVLGSDNRKMSKRWGNVVNPDEVVKNVGADTLRVYESFMGPFEQEIAWSTDSMIGSRRFLEKVWKLQDKIIAKFTDSNETLSLLHKTIKKVGEDIDQFNANTAVSAMMILINHFETLEKISKETYLNFVKILSPFAPHICEEIWSNLGGKKSIVLEIWPKYDETKIKSAKVKMVIQINGKVRSMVEIVNDLSQAEVEKIALNDSNVSKWISGQKIQKIFFVKNKIINFIV